jgi:tetratricopeptide (TPR) repeat protein
MKRIILLFAFLGHILATTAQSPVSNDIREAMNNYDYEVALQLMEKTPSSIPLLYLKGKALKELGRNNEALNVFNQLTKQDSLNPRAYIEAGECYKTLGKFQPALLCYKRVLDLKPDHKYARIQYISQLLNLQKYQEALGESTALAEQDSSATILHLKAQSLEGLYSDPNIQIGAYMEIHERYPDDYLAASKLASLYIRNNYYDYAIETCEAYRKTDTTNATVNRLEAQAYCLNQEYQKALERYQPLLAQGDSSFYNCYYAGISHYALNQPYEAHDLLEAARKHAPDHIDLLYYLGKACSKTLWKKKGMEYMEDAIRLVFPQDSVVARLYGGLADCCREAAEPRKQIKALMQQYKYNPQAHYLLYKAAFVSFYHLKDLESTEKYLEAYLKTRPKESKDQPQEMTEEGDIVINENNRYNAAEAWLQDLRKRKKVEDFFQGKTAIKVNPPTSK